MPLRSWVRTALFFATAVPLLQPGFCQTKGGGTGSSGTTGTSGTAPTGNAGSIGTLTKSTTSTTAPANPAAPVFISGRVMLDDGTAPPDSAAIERVCTSTTRTEGYTDSRGYFAIELGNEKGVFQDASEDGGQSLRSLSAASGTLSSGSLGSGTGRGDQRFENCDIRARLAGYRSQSISLATRRAMDTPDIGVILLHREGKDEGTTVSAVSLGAPKDARKSFEKGLAAVKKNHTEEAGKEFQRAVDLYPKYAAAWTELGKLQAAGNELVDARKSFDLAIQADPRFLDPFLQISLLAMRAKKWQELAEVTDRAMRLDPFELPQIYLFNSAANYNLKKFDAAERSISAAAKLDTLQQFAEISHLQGLILIQRRDYPAAAERLRNYLKLAPNSEDEPIVRNQLAQVDKAIAQNTPAPAGPKQDR